MTLRFCEDCGSTLDPGEKCNCEFKSESKLKEAARKKAKEISKKEEIAVFMFGGRIRRKR